MSKREKENTQTVSIKVEPSEEMRQKHSNRPSDSS